MAKILIIEDEAIIMEPLSEMLRFEKYEIVGASSGEEGLKMAVAEQPDLVLCDIVLVGMDGYQVLRDLRLDPATSKIPVIFLTGQVSHHEIQTGFAMGVDDYLCKPATRSDILTAIRKQLDKRRASGI